MNTNTTDWNQLAIDHELAYLRGDLATSSPESYTLDEMREISDAMDASTAEVEAALRADFNSLPPTAQGKMLDLLQQADPESFNRWLDLLLEPMPSTPSQISFGE